MPIQQGIQLMKTNAFNCISNRAFLTPTVSFSNLVEFLTEGEVFGNVVCSIHFHRPKRLMVSEPSMVANQLIYVLPRHESQELLHAIVPGFHDCCVYLVGINGFEKTMRSIT